MNILESLCHYDRRNPIGVVDYIAADELEDYPDSKSLNKDCACDNCFYGRTKLALYALDRYEIKPLEWGEHFLTKPDYAAEACLSPTIGGPYSILPGRNGFILHGVEPPAKYPTVEEAKQAAFNHHKEHLLKLLQ